MSQFYYNSAHPVEILESMTVKTSVCNQRDRGVSMSQRPIDSHGPFTFVFKEDRGWYSQFQAVEYGRDFPGGFDFLHKTDMFMGEYEVWSGSPVLFSLEDIEMIVFRALSPGSRIHPRIARRNFRELKDRFPLIPLTEVHLLAGATDDQDSERFSEGFSAAVHEFRNGTLFNGMSILREWISDDQT